MKKSLVIPLILLISAIGLLASCQAIAAPTSGYVLSVDSKKHLTQNVEYKTGNRVVSYNSDGGYKIYDYSWNPATSAWALSGGETGTYTWDTSTFVLTHTADFRHNTVQMIGLAPGESMVSTQMRAFTDHALVPVYAFASGILTQTETLKSAIDGNTTDRTTTTVLAFVDKSYASTVTILNTFNNVTTKTVDEIKGNVTGTFPENTTLAVGNTVTYAYQETAATRVTTLGVNPPTVGTIPGHQNLEGGSKTVTLINYAFAAIPPSDLSRSNQ